MLLAISRNYKNTRLRVFLFSLFFGLGGFGGFGLLLGLGRLLRRRFSLLGLRFVLLRRFLRRVRRGGRGGRALYHQLQAEAMLARGDADDFKILDVARLV